MSKEAKQQAENFARGKGIRSCAGKCSDCHAADECFVSEMEVERETERVVKESRKEKATKHLYECTKGNCSACDAILEHYGKCGVCGKIEEKSDLYYSQQLGEYFCSAKCQVKRLKRIAAAEKEAKLEFHKDRLRRRLEQELVKIKLKALGKKLRGEK